LDGSLHFLVLFIGGVFTLEQSGTAIMIKVTALCFTSLLAITACSSNNTTVPPNQQRLIQGTTTSGSGDTLVANFEYFNVDGLISAVYTYNYEDGLIVSRDFYEIDDVASVDLVDLTIATSSSRNAFSYENSRVVTRDYFNSDETLTSTRTFSYNTDGTLASSSSSSMTSGTTSTTTYLSEEGRCTSEFELTFRKYHCVN
jgi:hypothetical protein